MSKGGGSTQTQTQTSELPSWLQDAAKENLSRAQYVSQLGYMPYYGLDTAAFSPMQLQGMQATGMGAQAFGLAPQGFDATAGIPTPKTSNLGFSGYSSGDLYDQAVKELGNRNAGQVGAYNDMFLNKTTGAAPNVFFSPLGSFASPEASAAAKQMVDYSGSSGDTPTGQGAVDFMEALRAMHRAPDWVGALPIVGTIKNLGDAYLESVLQKQREAELAKVAAAQAAMTQQQKAAVQGGYSLAAPLVSGGGTDGSSIGWSSPSDSVAAGRTSSSDISYSASRDRGGYNFNKD